MQDEIDAVKGSLANYLTKSDAEATYATKTTVESLSQLLNQIKANYVSAEGLASTLEGYVTDAELADYPTLTVLQGGDPPERDGDEELAGRSDGADPGEI